MNCHKCGSPLEDGAVFCGNCGAKVESGPAQPAGGQAGGQGTVFCPNCGKRLAAGDVFCDECGCNLMGGAPAGDSFMDDTGKKNLFQKNPKLKIIIPAAVIGAVVVAGGAFAVTSLLGSGSSKEVPSHLVYFKDDSMMMINLKKKKAEPVELTDSYTKGGSSAYGIVGANYLSKDGKYVTYVEDYDGNDYDLFLAKVSKPEDAVKIDSKVSRYTLLDNHNVIYKKKDTLYLYNGKESVKLAKDVTYYYLDESQKNICWAESDKGEVTYYYQDIAQKNKAVKLDSDPDDFYVNKNLDKFYSLKEGSLYMLDQAGKKEKVAKDIAEILSSNRDLGMFYYTKTDTKEIPYMDLVYDDTGEMTEYNRERLSSDTFEWTSTELYFFDGKTEQLVTDRFSGRTAATVNEKGQYFLYKEGPELEGVQVPWSVMQENSWRSSVQNAMDEEQKLVLVSGVQKVGEFEDIICRDTEFHLDSKKLYLYTVDEDGEDGVIWVTALSGNGSGELKEYDNDAEDARLMFATDQGLYYLKDYDGDGGDLYFNGEEIASDVAAAREIGDSNLTGIVSDYDTGDSSYALSLWNGKKETKVGEDINYSECAEDGTVVLLSDYSSNREEGDLMYFDSKELRMLDDEVSGFSLRRDSTLIR